MRTFILNLNLILYRVQIWCQNYQDLHVSLAVNFHVQLLDMLYLKPYSCRSCFYLKGGKTPRLFEIESEGVLKLVFELVPAMNVVKNCIRTKLY